MVKVHTAENRFEAEQIEQALKNEGIVCWIKSYMDTAYDGIYAAGKGWGAIWVEDEQQEEARDIVAEFLTQYVPEQEEEAKEEEAAEREEEAEREEAADRDEES